jgi:hypothetical protein
MTPWTEDRLLARAARFDGWALEGLHEAFSGHVPTGAGHSGRSGAPSTAATVRACGRGSGTVRRNASTSRDNQSPQAEENLA